MIKDIAFKPGSKLPLPRLQLRWEPVDPKSKDGKNGWNSKCHYELVFKLHADDVRKDDEGDGDNPEERATPMGDPVLRDSSSEPCKFRDKYGFDAPYRYGMLAQRDAKQLGNLPILCIAFDGTAIMEAGERDDH